MRVFILIDKTDHVIEYVAYDALDAYAHFQFLARTQKNNINTIEVWQDGELMSTYEDIETFIAMELDGGIN